MTTVVKNTALPPTSDARNSAAGHQAAIILTPVGFVEHAFSRWNYQQEAHEESWNQQI
jgi:hypothetical protein